ncbi:uncharacterized protein [Magallana gigas]|uniref:uncharacterized protein isoform X1 n=1 Tax=Magallana gigas TaxID=29159 RepID=UPI00334000AC
MFAVHRFVSLSVIIFIKGIGSVTEAHGSIYSGVDVCSDSGHTTLNDKWREIGNGGSGNCDQGLPEGWYKFQINGKPAQIPTLCIKNKACGTVVPLRVDLYEQQVPAVNHSLRVSVCGSYTILGKWDCCVLRRPGILHNCGDFFVYHLSPPDRCDVGYCVVGGDNPMALHAFTAKTGEASNDQPHPTYRVPVSPTYTTPGRRKCTASERHCPNGCVPLSQSCPMTLDFNPLPKRIVHTFDTIRQTHFFTKKVRTTPLTTTDDTDNEKTTIDQNKMSVSTTPAPTTPPSTTPPSTTKGRGIIETTSNQNDVSMSTREQPTTSRTDPRETYTTVISSITSGSGPRKHLTSSDIRVTVVSVGENSVTQTSTNTHVAPDNTTHPNYTEVLTDQLETTKVAARDHDNQNEQPAADESYCGVVLAFEFEASYLQDTNFTNFRKKLQVVFASLLNIYYVEDHGVYLKGLFSWRMRYQREASKSYTFSHVHFGRGVHNESLYYITVFAEDIFNRVLYLPDRVLMALLQNATVTAYIQDEIRDFHATFLNLTTQSLDVSPGDHLSPSALLDNLALCVSLVVLFSIIFICALFAVLKTKSKNRCMKLRRKSGQYYVKWEKALKRDVCKGIVYIENPTKDTCIAKGDNSVNQTLIGPRERGCPEEEDNLVNQQRGNQFPGLPSRTFPFPECNDLEFIPGVQTKL